MVTKLRRRNAIPGELLDAATDHVYRSRGLRADWQRLNPDQARRFIELARWERGGESALDESEQGEFEALVEVAADLPAGHLAKEREEAALLSEVRRVARDALRVRPSRRSEGKFFAEVAVQQRRVCLSVDSAGVLLLVLAALFSGEGPGTATFKRDNDGTPWLRWQPGMIFGSPADGTGASRIERRVVHLVKNGWLVSEGTGQERWLSFGPRTRRVFDLGGEAE